MSLIWLQNLQWASQKISWDMDVSYASATVFYSHFHSQDGDLHLLILGGETWGNWDFSRRIVIILTTPKFTFPDHFHFLLGFIVIKPTKNSFTWHWNVLENDGLLPTTGTRQVDVDEWSVYICEKNCSTHFRDVSCNLRLFYGCSRPIHNFCERIIRVCRWTTKLCTFFTRGMFTTVGIKIHSLFSHLYPFKIWNGLPSLVIEIHSA